MSLAAEKLLDDLTDCGWVPYVKGEKITLTPIRGDLNKLPPDLLARFRELRQEFGDFVREKIVPALRCVNCDDLDDDCAVNGCHLDTPPGLGSGENPQAPSQAGEGDGKLLTNDFERNRHE